MLLPVVVISAFAVWGGRRLMSSIAAEAKIAANQKRFLPDELSNQMTDGGINRLRKGRIAELAIMFVDIHQFTELSETMTPRELSVLLSEYRPRVMAVIARHGVVVNKFIGDRVLVVFGLDSDPGAVAVSAIAAGHKALQTLEAWNTLRKSHYMDPIRVVVAIHASEVMIDNRGDQQRLEFSVLGVPVNKVSRIEAVAKENEAVAKENNVTLVISERILALAGNSADAGEWRSLGDLPLRGSSKQPRCSPFASWRSNRYRPVFRPRPVCGRSERWIAAHP